MRQTAVVIAPGRGTYNKAELGYLARNHSDRADMLARFDAFRTDAGQPTISELDGATRYSAATHTRGDNASSVIYACAYMDFLAIDPDKIEIIGVTGNSMGWYTAMACAGALNDMSGLNVVNTMGTLMHQSLIGGQLIYPFTDENWVDIPDRRTEIETKMAEIGLRDGHLIALSIDLGGMLVLAGNAQGLSAFEAEIEPAQGRFPMPLPNHAAFHTSLQAPISDKGMALLPPSLFGQPNLTMIDGRGGLWYPYASNLEALRNYTLRQQVVEPYDMTSAIAVAARELMPDVFIVLGPGNTLGGAVAQSLIQSHWRGWSNKDDFQTAQKIQPRLVSMGLDAQRHLVV